MLTIFLLSLCDQKEVVKKENKEDEGLIYSFQHPEIGKEYRIIHV